jgi:hypothetical protein
MGRVVMYGVSHNNNNNGHIRNHHRMDRYHNHIMKRRRRVMMKKIHMMMVSIAIDCPEVIRQRLCPIREWEIQDHPHPIFEDNHH